MDLSNLYEFICFARKNVVYLALHSRFVLVFVLLCIRGFLPSQDSIGCVAG